MSESLEDMKGVLAGGLVTGWTPDVAVGLWRRMLGTLGGINKVEDAENHALVFEELSLLIETMNKVNNRSFHIGETRKFSERNMDNCSI